MNTDGSRIATMGPQAPARSPRRQLLAGAVPNGRPDHAHSQPSPQAPPRHIRQPPLRQQPQPLPTEIIAGSPNSSHQIQIHQPPTYEQLLRNQQRSSLLFSTTNSGSLNNSGSLTNSASQYQLRKQRPVSEIVDFSSVTANYHRQLAPSPLAAGKRQFISNSPPNYGRNNDNRKGSLPRSATVNSAMVHI
jgi:hypothetical protein